MMFCLMTCLFASVPVSRLPQLVQETKEDLRRAGIDHTIVGHVGDGQYISSSRICSHTHFALCNDHGCHVIGNFHALLLFRNESEMEPIRKAVYRLVRRAIALDGTCK
jgi:D-lactate dehydrogenase (cytochrome)